jgi:hypothetical protein
MWPNHRSDKDTPISLCSWGQHTTKHDVVRDSFISITRDARFHVLREQTHVFPMPSFQISWKQMGIVLTVDGICILADVVIVDLTHVNLVSRATSFQGVVEMITLIVT